MYWLTITGAPAPACWTLFTFYVLDSTYALTEISLVLFSKSLTLTEQFFLKHSYGKPSIPRYLNLPINLINWSPLPNT